MSEQEKKEIRERVCRGLQLSYENLLRQKAAMGQDLVSSDGKGHPRYVPARKALADYLRERELAH